MRQVPNVFRVLLQLGIGLWIGLVVVAPGYSDSPQTAGDATLAEAKSFVEKSSKYLHHSRLKRGQKGYGLTVMQGATIVKFDVEIVSVVRNFEPGHDVILARLSGQNLEKSMVIAGMSGSPVYMTDSRDGKKKLIGAVAYGWGGSLEPLAGIQPITQMLAVSGILKAAPASRPKAESIEKKPPVSTTILQHSSTLQQKNEKSATISKKAPPPAQKPVSPNKNGVEIKLIPFGAFEINGLRVGDVDSMVTRVKRLAKPGPDTVITFITEKNVKYDRIAAAMEALGKAGYTKLKLVKESDAPAAPTGKKSDPTAAETQPAPAGMSRKARDRSEFLKIVLNPKKRDFSELYATLNRRRGQLAAIRLPVNLAGLNDRQINRLNPSLNRMGLMPVKSGASFATGELSAAQAKALKLAPGSSLCVPLVMGDADLTAIGTTTEIIGNKVLAFGHPFFAEGKVRMPMGTGYVHTIVITRSGSFKLGSMVRNVGEINRDESTAIAGVIGEVPAMVPMTVNVVQHQTGRKRRCTYQLIDEWYFTSRLAGYMLDSSATGLHSPPLYHHIRYSVEVDFGPLGKYKTANITSSLWEAESDLTRPIAALMANPFGKPVTPKSITATIDIHEGDITADITDFRIDGEAYRPGQTVTGKVTVERFRQKPLTVPVSFKLPDDLPEGDYPLTVGGASLAFDALQRSRPEVFSPKTTETLFGSLQKIVDVRYDRFYLRLPLKREGLALGAARLPDLPPSKAKLILQADKPNTRTFQTDLIRSLPTQYIVTGQKQQTITVKKHVNQIDVQK